MLTMEEVVKRLGDRNLRAVADAAGVSHGSVCNLVRSPSERVEYITNKKLSDYLEQNK